MPLRWLKGCNTLSVRLRVVRRRARGSGVFWATGVTSTDSVGYVLKLPRTGHTTGETSSTGFADVAPGTWAVCTLCAAGGLRGGKGQPDALGVGKPKAASLCIWSTNIGLMGGWGRTTEWFVGIGHPGKGRLATGAIRAEGLSERLGWHLLQIPQALPSPSNSLCLNCAC